MLSLQQGERPVSGVVMGGTLTHVGLRASGPPGGPQYSMSRTGFPQAPGGLPQPLPRRYSLDVAVG